MVFMYSSDTQGRKDCLIFKNMSVIFVVLQQLVSSPTVHHHFLILASQYENCCM